MIVIVAGEVVEVVVAEVVETVETISKGHNVHTYQRLRKEQKRTSQYFPA